MTGPDQNTHFCGISIHLRKEKSCDRIYLDVGGGGGVAAAVRVGVDSRITLVVDVESLASVDLGALVCALLLVIVGKESVSHVSEKIG